MRNTQCSSYNKYSLTDKKSTVMVKFSHQTVLRLCSDTETTPFKVNEVADIDSLIRQIHEINSRNHSITKVD